MIIRGTDVLAKAKTGTGKTLAFLIPSIEVVVNAMRNSSSSSGGGGGGSNKKISVLILSPTRELASQIGKECEVLLRFQPSLKCAVVFGGVPIKKDHGRIAGVDFLVATPGRLIDHLDNTAGVSEYTKNEDGRDARYIYKFRTSLNPSLHSLTSLTLRSVLPPPPSPSRKSPLFFFFSIFCIL